jgi:hypothetical protein
MSFISRSAALAALTLSLLTISSAVFAGPYSVALLDGGNWNTVYVQGFNTSLGASPDPGVANGSPVTLSKFEFFKSGTPDSASNVQVAILNNIFVDMSGGLTTNNSAFVGLSTNTVASTAGIATGDPIAFDFADLPLTYGANYAAVLVNVGTDTGSGTPLAPVLVSALTATYDDVGGGVFEPVPNYGGNNDFNLATSNFISAGFFNTFSFAGDANFRATLSAVPEPSALLLGLAVFGGAGFVGRRRG